MAVSPCGSAAASSVSTASTSWSSASSGTDRVTRPQSAASVAVNGAPVRNVRDAARGVIRGSTASEMTAGASARRASVKA